MTYPSDFHAALLALLFSAIACATVWGEGPGLATQPSRPAPVLVESREALQEAVRRAAPGDTIVIADGTWKDERIVIDGRGTEEAPVTVRARTPGKLVLTGRSSLDIRGSGIVVEGLHFRDGYLDSGHVIRLQGSHHTLRHTVIDRYNNPNRETRYFWVSLTGTHHLVEECTFRGMNHSGVTLVVWRDDDSPDYHVVRRNHFVDRPQGTGNGWEMIRIGTSGQSLSDSHTIVEENLFERCDGEVEIISNKSGRNIYRRNTFRASRGTLTLRHGDNCVVDSNFFLGENVRGSGGIRVIGEGHQITNNYIEGTQGRGGAAIAVNAGIPNSRLAGYFAAHRTLVAFNTIVGVSGPHIDLSTAYGRNRTVLPEGVVVANNLLVAAGQGDGPLVAGRRGPGLRAEGNIGHGRPAGSLDGAGAIRLANPRLDRTPDGIAVPSTQSVAAGAATGEYPEIKYDIAGRPRAGKKTVGCKEVSEAPAPNNPLTPADVGAPWARRL